MDTVRHHDREYTLNLLVARAVAFQAGRPEYANEPDKAAARVLLDHVRCIGTGEKLLEVRVLLGELIPRVCAAFAEKKRRIAA